MLKEVCAAYYDSFTDASWPARLLNLYLLFVPVFIVGSAFYLVDKW